MCDGHTMHAGDATVSFDYSSHAQPFRVWYLWYTIFDTDLNNTEDIKQLNSQRNALEDGDVYLRDRLLRSLRRRTIS
ncbi:hypothetical protein DDE83_000032 [Stemphylium lycopersici]|uniref:Uncharacterized protein n=1 Tax=Stemphylium lycopersici TaxID=183478 RepID=A0A364NGU3_STELY|nr:hypothetical protein DDE83_000032 [Stemphylium lycopersici]